MVLCQLIHFVMPSIKETVKSKLEHAFLKDAQSVLDTESLQDILPSGGFSCLADSSGK